MDSFHQFSRLPPELQSLIWGVILDDATAASRLIKVDVFNRLHVSAHSCVSIHDHVFCGNIERCRVFRAGEPNRACMFITDGFFASSDAEPVDTQSAAEQALVQLSTTCRASRDLMLRRFPETMRVHQRGRRQDSELLYNKTIFHASQKTRLLRCRPAVDLLLIDRCPDTSVSHIDESAPPGYLGVDLGHPSAHEATLGQHRRLNRIFPGDRDCFAHFRRVLSSFRHVAFSYLGERLFDPNEDGDNDNDNDNDSDDGNDDDVPIYQNINALLWLFEGVGSLYAWPRPSHWPGVTKDGGPVRVSDILTLPTTGFLHHRKVAAMVDELKDLIREYAASSAVRRSHSAPSNVYWVPQPKPLERIGCFAAKSWFTNGEAD